MDKDGTILIKNGIFVVRDPMEGGNYAALTPPKKGTLLINNIEVHERTEVRENDVIIYKPPNVEPNRHIDIKIEKDKMKAYINISYDPKIKTYLKDIPESNELYMQVIDKEEKNEHFFTSEEIIKELIDKGVVFGIKKDVLDEISLKDNVKNVIVAEGMEAIDAVDDDIKFLYKQEKTEDLKNSLKAIDYKNINNIESVSEGQVIANIITGKNSILGKNILGKEVRSKKNKIKEIIVGHGCRRNGDKIIALQYGHISFKNNVVTVNKVYEVKGDVNISTGNINFQGDVNISGNVTEGMLVCAKNNIDIAGGLFGCNVISLGDIKIQKNVINSNISAGGDDVNKYSRLQSVRSLEEVLLKIEADIEFIINKNLLHRDISLGEVIRTLIDTKYKKFNRICTEVISNTIKDRDTNSVIIKFIHERLIGLSILNINDLEGLIEGINLVREEIDFLEEEQIKSADVEVDYCQESKVQASGDIIIKGKGVFSTELHSLGKIEFVKSEAVCRGGTLNAKKQIKASIVGTISGVKTILEVEEKDGQIIIDVAYSNTEIRIDNKRYTFEKASKQINCYINSQGELIVDKFNL